MKTTASISGIPITLNYGDMSDSVRLWIEKVESGENRNKNYIFARIMHDDTVFFYTEEGFSFYNVKFNPKLPVEMYLDKLLVGMIYAEPQDEESDFVKLTVKLYANPKESNKETTELVKFKKDIIKRFGL
jgi:hypothetical protein